MDSSVKILDCLKLKEISLRDNSKESSFSRLNLNLKILEGKRPIMISAQGLLFKISNLLNQAKIRLKSAMRSQATQLILSLNLQNSCSKKNSKSLSQSHRFNFNSPNNSSHNSRLQFRQFQSSNHSNLSSRDLIHPQLQSQTSWL